MKIVFMFMSACAVVLLGAAARANPRPLPYTYPNETLPEGELEIEQYTDVNPLRVPADATDPNAGNLWAPEYRLQTEIEYGVTDRVELGFYQVFEASPQPGGDAALAFDGLKWRVRTRLAEPGKWPVDVGLYLELETMHDEIALEWKVNLQRRFGRLRLMTNLWAEEAIERPLEKPYQGRSPHFIVNPTGGFVYEITPTFQPGVEFWCRGQIAPGGESEQDRQNSRVHYFVGPTAHFNFGKLWWSLGAYAHLNDADTPPAGAAYGPFWVRSVLGLEL